MWWLIDFQLRISIYIYIYIYCCCLFSLALRGFEFMLGAVVFSGTFVSLKH